jgi:hypothetical protein
VEFDYSAKRLLKQKLKSSVRIEGSKQISNFRFSLLLDKAGKKAKFNKLFSENSLIQSSSEDIDINFQGNFQH